MSALTLWYALAQACHTVSCAFS